MGVDAVLVADIPLLAAEPYIQTAKKYGIQPVFICPPNADEQTIKAVAENSEGYTYLVSRAGVTSAENQQ
ncbi:tryptophan synthase subunit alpha [Canicola haemoglobinophilus]|nr:tryptophan synthase subunit alpha [Canicola haemoglobinophilus]STO68530.1 tryptophan synthase subunit alpha [Canicola haemoglobinophilus]